MFFRGPLYDEVVFPLVPTLVTRVLSGPMYVSMLRFRKLIDLSILLSNLG